MSKPFFYRINAADFLAQVSSIKSDRELAKFIRQFSVDLVTGSANSSYAKSVIAEATEYINKKKEAGSKGGKQKASNAKAPLKHRSSKGLASNSNSNSSKTIKDKYAENVTLQKSEYQNLVDEHGEEKTRWMISKLDAYKGSNGKKYKDDYRAIISWVVDKAAKEFRHSAEYRDPMAGY